MSLLAFCEWLAATEGSTALRESLFMYPLVESTHVLFLLLFVGMTVVWDLRLLGKVLTDVPVTEMAEFICRALEDLPPQVAADVIGRPISLTGGGAQLDHLDAALHKRVGVAFAVPETPMHCVIRGSAAVLESLELREHLLIGP